MKIIATALIGLDMIAGTATAQPVPTGTPLSIARIVSSIQEGQPWGTIANGLICIYNLEHLNWGVGAGKLNVRAFESPARSELKKEGFSIIGDPTDPFVQEKTADLVVGGAITAIHGDFCVGGNYFEQSAMKGSASIEVDWQLYSTIERRTLIKVHTSGSAKTEVSKQGEFQTLLIDALDDSLRKFTSTDDFKSALAAKPLSGGSPPSANKKTVIALSGSKTASPMVIRDAVGSVVLVLSGGGHGSGFLVSLDGYVLTAEHVVGSDKYVKIRWSDGLEAVGEVVRTDKKRDVALVKVDSRGRAVLALRRESPQPGDTVFAIGAPLEVSLQGTVTRGVASANRIIDGFSFIQSDVTVNPGNSGGPLLDEKGEVLGIADLVLRDHGDAPTGINFFIPVRDALDFLSLEQR